MVEETSTWARVHEYIQHLAVPVLLAGLVASFTFFRDLGVTVADLKYADGRMSDKLELVIARVSNIEGRMHTMISSFDARLHECRESLVRVEEQVKHARSQSYKGKP